MSREKWDFVHKNYTWYIKKKEKKTNTSGW